MDLELSTAFFLPFFVYLSVISRTTSESVSCAKNSACGYNSLCINRECICNEGFVNLIPPAGGKGKNCVDKKCENGKCYTCIDQSQCRRCVQFVTEGTGKCSDECKTEYVLKTTGEFLGNVCKAPKKSKWGEYIGIIVGLCLAAVLVIAIGIIIYIIKKRKSDEATRRQIEEIKARKKREKKERKKAKDSNKNVANSEDSEVKSESGNNTGARDFKV